MNIASFLETLLGGLMVGMLYSLVALGFVLIYKASGVFNFAQGAMVLFAALAMARFAEWIPAWTGINNPVLAGLGAFIVAGAIMFIVAWLIERLALRHLVNQEATTLLMARWASAIFWTASARRFSVATSTRSTSACRKTRSWRLRAPLRAAS